MRLPIPLLLAASIAVFPLTLNLSAQSSSSAAPTPIPTIDGAAGPCSLDLTVLTPDRKPAASATVKVHIAYRFGGFHKLDLEAGTNADGKVKFTGLPSRVRRSVLEFQATKDDLSGTIQYDPSADCHGTKEITLQKDSSMGK
jgi:hypothetical protein